jgi:hypothetical protein
VRWYAIAAAACLGVAASLALSGCMSQAERAALLAGPYSLEVDYGKTVEQLLAEGGYNWVYYRITSAAFPDSSRGQARLSATLVPFSPQASIPYVLQEEEAAGLRPATLKELLTFGASYPEVQRRIPVIALGSHADLLIQVVDYDSRGDWMFPFTTIVRKVKRLYPFLSDGLPGRTVNLDWLEDPGGYSLYYACFVRSH